MNYIAIESPEYVRLRNSLIDCCYKEAEFVNRENRDSPNYRKLVDSYFLDLKQQKCISRGYTCGLPSEKR